MNLILLTPNDLQDQDYISGMEVVLRDRRFQHIRQIHQPEVGNELKIGLLNGDKGTARVLHICDTEIRLSVTLKQPPPSPLPLTLLLALPRPKMLKRILQTVSAMGVKQLYLLNAYRVDKSYWSSPVLNSIEEHLLLGLEQAGDTVMPEVHLKKRFKPFVEDELPEIIADSRALIAHPYLATPCPSAESIQTTLAVGPEGGFIPYEVQKLQEAGMQPIHIGERILRVETAVPALLSRLFPV